MLGDRRELEMFSDVETDIGDEDSEEEDNSGLLEYNDLGAGGTVARLRAAGCRVAYLTVTDDLLGVLDPDLPDAEARKVAALQTEQRILRCTCARAWFEVCTLGAAG